MLLPSPSEVELQWPWPLQIVPVLSPQGSGMLQSAPLCPSRNALSLSSTIWILRVHWRDATGTILRSGTVVHAHLAIAARASPPCITTQVSAMHLPLVPQSCPLPPHPVAFMQSSPPKPCLHIHLAFLKYLTVELSVCAITVHLPRYWPPHSLGHNSFSQLSPPKPNLQKHLLCFLFRRSIHSHLPPSVLHVEMHVDF